MFFVRTENFAAPLSQIELMKLITVPALTKNNSEAIRQGKEPKEVEYATEIVFASGHRQTIRKHLDKVIEENMYLLEMTRHDSDNSAT